MASAKSGGFTSVAPQENSTEAFIPLFLRNLFVKLTSSVAIFLPFRSSTVLIG